jgi:ribosomal protein S9
MSKWSNGLASDQDVLKEIDLNIGMLAAKQKPTTGKIKTTIASWITAEKNTKIALDSKNVEAITSAMNLKISSITNFDKLCKSIEK